MRGKRGKRMEFSKLILIVAGGINIFIIVFACVMMWRTNDLSPLTYLIPSVAAETATGTGFYYSKAKVENRIKLMQSHQIKISKEDFNENSLGGITNG